MYFNPIVRKKKSKFNAIFLLDNFSILKFLIAIRIPIFPQINPQNLFFSNRVEFDFGVFKCEF